MKLMGFSEISGALQRCLTPPEEEQVRGGPCGRGPSFEAQGHGLAELRPPSTA
jgi:hypothetical protein